MRYPTPLQEIRSYHDPRLTPFAEMHDIVSQMALRWARFGEDEPIDASSDFTRLTLDTIAL